MEFDALTRLGPNMSPKQQIGVLISAIEELQQAVLELKSQLVAPSAHNPAFGGAGEPAAPLPNMPGWTAEERELLASAYSIDFLRQKPSTVAALKRHVKILSGIPTYQMCLDLANQLKVGTEYHTKDLGSIWRLSQEKTRAFRYFMTLAKMLQNDHPLYKRI